MQNHVQGCHCCLEPGVANFFLIDHSLSKSGGHHFDYVRCVAKAANEMGYLTTIGTHRDLAKDAPSATESLDRLGTVRRVFRETTYQADSNLAGLQHLTRSQSNDVLQKSSGGGTRLARAMNRLKALQHRRRRQAFIKRFAKDCELFFRQSMQVPGDHVFLTTVSELELLGLAEYLSANPKTLQTRWHLQFHFNLFEGRSPEYATQEHVVRAVRASFLTALSKIPYHSIYFYNTSRTLVDQYRRLGVGEFNVLPYPISTDFAPDENSSFTPRVFEANHESAANYEQVISRLNVQSESGGIGDSSESNAFAQSLGDDTGGTVYSEAMSFGEDDNPDHLSDPFSTPLRITCPGEVRREKGHVEYLQPLIDSIWDSHLESGKVQVVLQRPKKKLLAKKHKLEIELPDSRALTGVQPVEYFSHPLSHDEYVALIRSTDIGLLFYDSRVYFSRRAGVLGELLSCGKPVIVPAGSWLADQVEESIFVHVDQMMKSHEVTQEWNLYDVNWSSSNAPMAGGVLSFDQNSHPFEFSFDVSNQTALAVEFQWQWPKESGVYCRLDMRQYDSEGELISNTSRVIGHRRSNRSVKSLFGLDERASQVTFALTNAFHDSTCSIKDLVISGIDAGNEAIPIGKVGVIASDEADLPNCIAEASEHFEHYRTSAEAFSRKWYARHDPRLTVDRLISVDGGLRRAA